MPAPAHEHIYHQAIKQLRLNNMSPQKRIKALLTNPMEEIVGNLSGPVAFNAVTDGEIVITEAGLCSCC